MTDPLDGVLRLVAEGRLSPEEAAPIIDALSSARATADGARATAGRARETADRARTAGEAARDAARAAAEAARLGFAARRTAAPTSAPPTPGSAPGTSASLGPPRRLRIQVRDDGRKVIDLQLPGVLAELAGAVPGIPATYVDRVRDALRTGLRGPIVDVTDEDGSGITITLD